MPDSFVLIANLNKGFLNVKFWKLHISTKLHVFVCYGNFLTFSMEKIIMDEFK